MSDVIPAGKRKLSPSAEECSPSPKKSVSLPWKIIRNENLNLSYLNHFLAGRESSQFFARLEDEIEYLSGDLAKVRVYGKWHDLPRRQVLIL